MLGPTKRTFGPTRRPVRAARGAFRAIRRVLELTRGAERHFGQSEGHQTRGQFG